jgi:hypothetical protein
VAEQLVRLGREADAVRRRRQPRDVGQDVGVLDQRRRGGGAARATSAGRQSATAAQATNTSCAAASASTAACISRAVVTSTRRTPRGVGSATGPATSSTSAPASAAARAIAKPIFPLERLVRPRTGSIGSKVGPAVTSTRRPARCFGAKKAIVSARISSGSSMRPSPVSPQAWSPLPGPSTVVPSARSCATLRCVAGCDHISRFIAGATSSAQRSIGRATQASASRSSARPCSSRARKSALAGATTIASASRVRLMCAMLLGSRASHGSANTGRPESACSVTAPMKRCADSVITTCTLAPSLAYARTSSAPL